MMRWRNPNGYLLDGLNVNISTILASNEVWNKIAELINGFWTIEWLK
jgi:hypothetical protein